MTRRWRFSLGLDGLRKIIRSHCILCVQHVVRLRRLGPGNLGSLLEQEQEFFQLVDEDTQLCLCPIPAPLLHRLWLRYGMHVAARSHTAPTATWSIPACDSGVPTYAIRFKWRIVVRKRPDGEQMTARYKGLVEGCPNFNVQSPRSIDCAHFSTPREAGEQAKIDFRIRVSPSHLENA